MRTGPALGTGIYTYAEAARLLRVSVAKVRGWAEGYVRHINGEQRRSQPVLQREVHRYKLLTFFDLIELFFVREFTNAGVKLSETRAAAEYLSQQLNTPYPFACCKLDTDGVQLLQEAGDAYINVAHQQRVFEFVKLFFKDIDFDDDCQAKAWWPLGRDKFIVIDPKRAFGAPIDVRSGVRTEIIYSTYKAEGDVQAVADWYEIKPDVVEAAIEFEEQRCQKAA